MYLQSEGTPSLTFQGQSCSFFNFFTAFPSLDDAYARVKTSAIGSYWRYLTMGRSIVCSAALLRPRCDPENSCHSNKLAVTEIRQHCGNRGRRLDWATLGTTVSGRARLPNANCFGQSLVRRALPPEIRAASKCPLGSESQNGCRLVQFRRGIVGFSRSLGNFVGGR